MPEEKRRTVSETLIEFALEDTREHQVVMATIPVEKLSAVIGRKGKLTIDGEEGGVFIIKLTPYGIFSDEKDTDIRNEIWMTDTTFIDIVIGELEPRKARARGQVLFTGDRNLYDAAEIIDVFEKWIHTKLRPVAKRMMLSVGEK